MPTMAKEKLSDYERKRSFDRTPEPRGRRRKRGGSGGERFVIQEHHARRIHWDLRLERDGTLASWALPRGVPAAPKDNRLAVRTEDHPLEYLDFEGEIPRGQYGAGTMMIWDRGTYVAEKFSDEKVEIELQGERVHGRYALFPTKGNNWMIHRMDPPEGGASEPLPRGLRPMLACPGRLPRDEAAFAYELKWDGVRALAYCEPGRVRLESRNLRDVSSQYPEVTRALREAIGAHEALVDGEVVAFDEEGRPDFQRLQQRMHLGSASAVRRRMADAPTTYIAFDLLHLDGRSLLDSPYEERRRALDSLGLDGPHLQAPSDHRGDGRALLALTQERGLEGLVAKRLDSVYVPGRRNRGWIKVKNVRTTELVVGGWMPGQGGRTGRIGALLVGYHDDGGDLRYAGRVGSGFTERVLDDLGRLLSGRERDESPFVGRQPPKESRFARPELVARVEFKEWTRTGTLRAPSFKGLRDDVAASEIRRDHGA
jgi:bifunctional non-homologous end joining protein LigD